MKLLDLKPGDKFYHEVRRTKVADIFQYVARDKGDVIICINLATNQTVNKSSRLNVIKKRN